LGKRYKIYSRPADRLLEWATLGRLNRHHENWVLRGVQFEIKAGEAVAFIGANGAGKSTLLRLIAGTTQPSEGFVETSGRVAALELGLGFHPDFTGRENAYAAGELIGLRRAEIESLMPSIEDFAEIGEAISEPVRTYSSGMQLRLAFSVATAVRPEILIVDEVLAVGDAYFQHKCISRIRRFREEGATLLFVSHDAAAVTSLCDRAFLLDEGLLVREGAASAVLDYYNAMIARMEADYEIRQGEALGDGSTTTRSGTGAARIEAIELLDAAGPSRAFRVGEEMRVLVRGSSRDEIQDLTVGLSIRDRIGNEVFGTNSYHLGQPRLWVPKGGAFSAEFRLPANLGVGNYNVTVALHAGAEHVEGNYDWWDRAQVFQVVPHDGPLFVGCAYLPASVKLEGVRASGAATQIRARENRGREPT